MNTIEYEKETSLTNFMDQFTIQRLDRIIGFEQRCTPRNEKLIESCMVLIKHLRGIWDIK